MKPLILISNDDGYQAKGINCLIDMLHEQYRIIVVAPDKGRSGEGCHISINQDITLKLISEEKDLQIFSCSGTPADCVKLALSEAIGLKPDLVISGINHGFNASTNEHYSGTMGAAKEGAMHGVPSLALSLCDLDLDADFEPMRRWVVMLCNEVIKKGLPRWIVLNANYPAIPELKGYKLCRMADQIWTEEFKEVPGKGEGVYRMGGKNLCMEPEAEDTDLWAVEHGYISLTPITIDETDYKMLENLKDWNL